MDRYLGYHAFLILDGWAKGRLDVPVEDAKAAAAEISAFIHENIPIGHLVEFGRRIPSENSGDET
jgi:hypothetical protein